MSKHWAPGKLTMDNYKKDPRGITGAMEDRSSIQSKLQAISTVKQVQLGKWESKKPGEILTPDYLLKHMVHTPLLNYARICFLNKDEGRALAKKLYPTADVTDEFIHSKLTELTNYLEAIGQNLNKARKYNLIQQWYDHILNMVYDASTAVHGERKTYKTGELQTKIYGQEYSMGEIFYLYKNILFMIYLHMCVAHGKLMVGVANGVPLWVEMPTHLQGSMRVSSHEWLDLTAECFFFLDILSGAQDIHMYDRLLLPAPDRWPRWAVWAQLSHITEISWLNRVSKSMGYQKPVECTKDGYEAVLADIFLKQNRILVENRPALVKIDGNTVIDTILLMRKGNFLFAKFTAYEGFEFLECISLTDGTYSGWLSSAEATASNKYDDYQYLLPTLISQVYRDIVVAEVKISTRKRRKEAPLPTLVEVPLEGITGFGEAVGAVRWRLIPQKNYIKKVDDTSDKLIETRPLTPKEGRLKQAANSFAHVRPFARTLPEGWHVRQTTEYRQEFLETYKQFNIQLGENQVAVKPHGRGAARLETFLSGLSDQDIKDIAALPHYLKKPRSKA